MSRGWSVPARLIFLCVLLLTPGQAAQAHERSRSHSSWQVSGDSVTAQFVVDARLTTLLLTIAPAGSSLEDALHPRLVDGLRVERGGQACAMAAAPASIIVVGGQTRTALAWTCPTIAGALTLSVAVFAPLSANHVHFLRLQGEDGFWDERVLSRNRATASFALDDTGPAGWLPVLGRYFQLGFEHILGGADHLTFLAALLLVLRRRRDALLVTLGFTAGHSITLALTALGMVAPPGLAVEAVIGFSIVFVAAEAALGQREDLARLALLGGGGLVLIALASALFGGVIGWPVWLGLALLVGGYGVWLSRSGEAGRLAPVVSGVFGLVHGVGFGGVLVATQLPADRIVPSLLGFNIGVEAGQVLVLALAALIYTGLGRFLHEDRLALVRAAMLAVVATLGMFWFVSRSIG
jgi:hypothetical protein